MRRRAVITGLGIVSCLGSDVDTFWRRLLAGETGIRPMTKLDPEGLRNENAGEVVDFSGDGDVDEAMAFAVGAALQAFADAGLTIADAGERLGLVFSTNFGGTASWEQFVDGLLDGDPNGDDFENFAFQAAADRVAERLDARGPVFTLSNSCSSGASALGAALDLIRTGQADVVIAGGHDSLGLSILAGLSILRTITAEKLRPFDKNRSGTIFSEGAGMLVLEAAEHAAARGAEIYAELVGCAINNNAYHLTAPDKDGTGMVEVLRAAIADAGIDAAAVDYVNAHATGTQYHDVAETNAIKTVLGQRAYEIPVTSIKGSTGHGMAAAGAMEAIATVLAMRDGAIPPTVNYQTPDPECDLDYVPNVSRAGAISTAVSISAGIGGNNSALVLTRGVEAT